MEKSQNHISSYTSLGIVLVVLLSLTALSVFITQFHFGAFSVAVAMLIAAVKGSVVLIYFMHLKFESGIVKVLVGGVFILYLLIFVVTFIDYLFR